MSGSQIRVIRGRRAGLLLVTCAISALSLAIVAATVNNAHVAGAVAAVFMLIVGVRIWMMGLRILDEGIQIVDTFSATTVPWEDIERFEIEPLAQYPYGTFLVRRGNLGRIPILAMTGNSAQTFDKIRPQVEELNELVARRGSVAATGSELLDLLR